MDAQRRQLTVTFCDLVGATALSARLDPEDLRDVIAAYHRACVECIERTGGFVAQYLGDGVLAYFGYPRAREDDAARAVHAALMVVDAIPELPTQHGEPLAVRVGIATGLVVAGDRVGSGSSGHRSVIGETPNFAARLQSVAGPNQVAISQTTHDLAGGLFDYQDLGLVELKGLPRPERVWRAVRRAAVADRFSARRGGRLAPIVGREQELQLLLDLWRRRAAGRGCVVGLHGEAGIGKSRLVHEFRRRIAGEAHIWIEGGGNEMFRLTPFYAVTQMIRRSLGRSGDGAVRDLAIGDLERALSLAGLDAEESLPLVAELAGLPLPAERPPSPMPAPERRRRSIATLSRWVLQTAVRAPTALVIEDLHWADPSTLELLDDLVARGPQVELFILYTQRDGYESRWRADPSHSRVDLCRLDSASVRDLVSSAAPRGLPDSVLDQIVSRADGNPLFAEELARVVAAGEGQPREPVIPSTLSDLLMARLDSLGPARRVAQILSIFGRDFSYDQALAMCGLPAEDFRQALDVLIGADVVFRRGPGGDWSFRFRHSLIQDAAYLALLKSERRELHRRAAGLLESRFPEAAAARPEIVARHLANSDEPRLAVAAWRKAGRIASARGAFREAEAAYREALAGLATIGDTAERDAVELQLQGALAGVLQITRGYSNAETIAAAERARRLAQAAGDLSVQLRQVGALWAAASSAGDYAAAIALADQVMSLAQAHGKPSRLGYALMAQMTARYRVGELEAAEGHFAAGAPCFADPGFVRRPGQVAQVYGNAAQNAWILGDEAEARRRMDHALSVCEGLDSPFDLAFAHSMAAMLSVMMTDLREAARRASLSLELCERHGFPQIGSNARISLGRALAGLGDTAGGPRLIGEGLRGMADAGHRVALTVYLTWLAEAEALAGDLRQALATLDRALCANPGELFFRPETLRLRGDLRFRLGRAAEAVEDARAALALSSGMRATRFHRRAVESLARMAPAA